MTVPYISYHFFTNDLIALSKASLLLWLNKIKS